MFWSYISKPKRKAGRPRVSKELRDLIKKMALDNGWGINAGYNPVFLLSDHFSIEALAGYGFTKITGQFLSGDQELIHTSSLLLGPRIYFLKKDKRIRPYLNVLAGPSLTFNKEEGHEITQSFGLGLSTGIFIDISQVMLGIYIASPDEIDIRFGYSL